MESVDIVVIGAGIAGASVAAHLAETHSVVILEREDHAGYHSTGRSAALFSEIYGNDPVRALSRASRDFFFNPPPDFCAGRLVSRRGSLFIANAGQRETLVEFAALPDVAAATRWVDTAEARSMCPILREDRVTTALYEEGAMDIDVNELHQGYLRRYRNRGGRIVYDAAVEGLERRQDQWLVLAGETRLSARIVVNAAGAWADDIAALAGAHPIGLTPRRRTALLVDPPAGLAIQSWPIVIDIDEQFYFKPDAGLLLLSPADETPTLPCDAQPEEWDVAVGVDRVEAATTLQVRRIKNSWAGLRSFVDDRTPVAGFAEDAPGFFWLAAQGGYGIQTAPALAKMAAALIRRVDLPDDLARAGVRAADLSPSRIGRSTRVTK